MSTEEVFVHEFSKLFVHYREALSISGNGEDARELDGLNEVPIDERDRMVAAARLALLEIESHPRDREHGRRYYAEPGEAEWGC
jgi:hypothetical protein